MKRFFLHLKLAFIFTTIAVVFGFCSFRKLPETELYSFRQKSARPDEFTHKYKRNWTDRHNDQLSRQLAKFDIDMQNIDEQMSQIDLSQQQKKISEAMKEFNVAKISKQMELAQTAIADADIQQQINIEVNLKQIRKNLELVKRKPDDQKFEIQIDSKKMNAEVKTALDLAKRSITHTKEEHKKVKEFSDELEKDHLINKTEGYKVELRNGELYINGQKQTAEITDKYRRYYPYGGNFFIRTDAADDLWI